MLEEFDQEIWIEDGPGVAVAGFHYPTRMAVIRLSNGGLFIWSPIQLTASLQADVDDVGPVRHIVAPNSLRHLFLPAWKSAYPAALMYAPPRLRRKREDIVFDANLGSAPSPDWAGEIDQVVMQGNLITTEVVFFHKGAGPCCLPAASRQLDLRLAVGGGEAGLHDRARTLRAAQVSYRLCQSPGCTPLSGTHSRMARRKGTDCSRNTHKKQRQSLCTPRV